MYQGTLTFNLHTEKAETLRSALQITPSSVKGTTRTFKTFSIQVFAVPDEGPSLVRKFAQYMTCFHIAYSLGAFVLYSVYSNAL
jgi:hypothetical protein